MTGVVLFELCFVWVVFCLSCGLFELCFVCVVLFVLCFVWVVVCLSCVLFELCFVWVVFCLCCVLFYVVFFLSCVCLNCGLFELCFVWVVFCLGCVLFVLCFVWVVICLSCVLFELFFVWVVFRWNIRIQFKNQFENTRRRAIYKKNYINLDKAKIKQERWRTRMKRRQYQINLKHHSDESIEFQNPGWKLKWKHPKGTISKKLHQSK